VLERIAQDAGVWPPPRLAPQALDQLRRYTFPGNVRELENLLHRAVALSGGEWVDEGSLLLPDAYEGDTVLQDFETSTPGARLEAPAAAPAASQPALPADLEAYLDAVERDVLGRALERHRFNRTAAGASLGLSLRQMRYRMARLGVMVAEHGVAPDSDVGE
jgi:two-component system, NtrC family, response regulator PilR